MLSGKVSAIATIQTMEDFALAERLDDLLAAAGIDHETVLVAYNVDDRLTMMLSGAIDRIPDATVHFLHTAYDPEFARLVGIDNAIGDWMLIAGPASADPAVVHDLLQQAEAGYSHVVPAHARYPGRSRVQAWIKRGFFRIYNRLSGIAVIPDAPVTRLLSRALALFVVTSPHGEMLLRCRKMPSGFATQEIDAIETIPDKMRQRRTAVPTLLKALAVLAGAGATPLRLVTMFAVISGAVNVLYILYVFGSFVWRPNLSSGWTTLSLQIAWLYFVCIIFFALIGEYIARISGSINYRLVYRVVREQRSTRSRVRNRLNVVNN